MTAGSRSWSYVPQQNLLREYLKVSETFDFYADHHLKGGGKLTKKQWETIRNFARSWPEEREKYVEEIGDMEREFKDKLLSGYQTGIFTPICRKI